MNNTKEAVGNINVTVYKESNQYSFDVNPSNEDVLPISYVLEDTLKLY